MKFLIALMLCISCVWSSTIYKKEFYGVQKDISPRIIGGKPVEEAEFPFIAAIWTTTTIGKYFCGGAIIDRQWILTAAHCVLDAVSFSIKMGSVGLSSTDINRVAVKATKSVIHPDFDRDTFVNNVGLINLDDALKLNDYVNVIALPSEDLVENINLISIGWGQTDDQHSGPVDILQKVEVVSLLNEHCANFYGNQITETMVCAMGAFNEGTCIGDIGGPLIQVNDDAPILVATASFLSFNGCESLDPSGYERTFSYINWIKNVTSSS